MTPLACTKGTNLVPVSPLACTLVLSEHQLLLVTGRTRQCDMSNPCLVRHGYQVHGLATCVYIWAQGSCKAEALQKALQKKAQLQLPRQVWVCFGFSNVRPAA